MFVPRVDAIAEVSRCGHSRSDERRMKMARQARAAPQQAREASPEKASTQSLYEGCVIGVPASNGIPAAASFLVGIAPSKTSPHRQATFLLCALLLRANAAEALPRPLRRHAP
jgi:hypothetical protein